MELTDNFSDKAKRDYDLVQAAKNGSEKAFAELLSYYREPIYYMLLKMVSNTSDAEDLTIEAFGKAFKNIKHYTPSFAFSTWLFKIASNNCIDFLRKRKNQHQHISIDGGFDEEYIDSAEAMITLQSDEPSPAEMMIIQQKETLVRAIIEELNPRYRKLIELRYFKEYSYFEISEELDLPVGTVKARLFRAKNLIITTLNEKESQ